MHGPKRNRFSSKLARPGKFGDASGWKPALRNLAKFYPGALQRACPPTLMPQVVTWLFIPGCLSKRPASLPAAAPGDGFQRKGPQPLPSGRLGKGSRGKPSRKGFPLASLWGRPVSLGERNGSHMPTSIEVSPILRGCLLSLLKIPARRSLCLAHFASGLDAMSVVDRLIPPSELDIMPPKMLARTAGFFHFLSPPSVIIHYIALFAISCFHNGTILYYVT